jgi:hypothetical protein
MSSSSYFTTPNYKVNQDRKLVQLADKAIHFSKELLVSTSWQPLVVLGTSAALR